MTASFPLVSLGSMLQRSEEMIEIQPDQTYKQVTVRLWGQGVILRDQVPGIAIAGQRRFVVRSQQFILSRIDARNGAFGIIPDILEGAIVTNDFPVFLVDQSKIIPKFLEWMSRTQKFIDLCNAASEGTTNRVRLKEDIFLSAEITLPPIKEQCRIVTLIGQLVAKIEEARVLKHDQESEIRKLLLSAYYSIVKDADYALMKDVAPLERRPVEIDLSARYFELGIRSFGNGTFHKPPLNGTDVGAKRLYKIESGDLLFNVVFAWEGAVAVAKPEDHGLAGSHRFLTCVPKQGVATSKFLCFHFLTPEGLQQLGDASPGGAGRNRTLGLDALANIQVPIPLYEKQVWFDELLDKVVSFGFFQSEAAVELDALLPSILDKAFKGEL